MNIIIGKREIGWSFFSQLSHVGANLIILPFVVASLSTEDLAMWYVFMAISGFAVLIDFGFQSNICKYFTYALVGVERIEPTGTGPVKEGEPNFTLLSQLYAVANNIYFKISLISLSIMQIVGVWYFLFVFELNLDNVLAWLIYSAYIYVNLRFVFYKPMLRGIGCITESHKGIVISKFIFVVLGLLFLALGFDLIGLCSAGLFSSIIYRVISVKQFVNSGVFKSKGFSKLKVFDRDVYDVVLVNSKKVGLLLVSDFVNYRYVLLIAPFLYEPSVVASLGLTIQMLLAMRTFCMSYFNVFLPKFASLDYLKDIVLIKELFAKVFFRTFGLVLVAFGFFIVLLEIFLDILGGNVQALPLQIIVLLTMFYLLDLFYKSSIAVITVYNFYPYVKPVLVSLFFVLVGVPILGFYEFELVLILLYVFMIQCSFNNWFWFNRLVNGRVDG